MGKYGRTAEDSSALPSDEVKVCVSPSKLQRLEEGEWLARLFQKHDESVGGGAEMFRL